MPIADGRVQASEKEWRQDGLVKIVSALQRCFEPVDEKSALAVEPSFLLDEVQKQQPRQNQKRLCRCGVARFFRELRPKQRVDFADGGSESLEKLSRQRFAIERPIEKARVIGILRRLQQIQAID